MVMDKLMAQRANSINGFAYIFILFFLCLFTQLHATENEGSIKGDVEKGKELASKKCDRCHGTLGVSEDSDTPHLASQSAVYMLKQLKDYKSKERSDKNMYKRTRKLTDQQMADISVWYEKQVLPEISAFSEEKTKIPQLVTKGDSGRSIPPCEICHGKDGKNVAGGIPKLAGQNADYLISTMEYFSDGSRSNDQGGAVRTIIKKLSDVEINALAHYYANLGGRPVGSED